MGSAALYHLASRGVRVLGVDRFAPPHIHGSTHGRTRIIREAYYEHPCYVPIVQRAYELWAALEREAGESLFVQTGGLMIGPPDGSLFAGALRSAREHGLAHTVLEPDEVHARFPGFRVPDGLDGASRAARGAALPGEVVETHLALAQRAGATIRTGVTVTGWDADEGVRGAHGCRSVAREHAHPRRGPVASGARARARASPRDRAPALSLVRARVASGVVRRRALADLAHRVRRRAPVRHLPERRARREGGDPSRGRGHRSRCAAHARRRRPRAPRCTRCSRAICRRRREKFSTARRASTRTRRTTTFSSTRIPRIRT